MLVIKMECIFCKIANGEIPSKKIYEDDEIMAFLDINPLTPGHTLIVPKEHTLDFQSISMDKLMKIMNVSRELSQKIVDKMGAQGYTLIQNNGIAQDVKHFHLHIIPKYKDKLEMSVDEVYKKIAG